MTSKVKHVETLLRLKNFSDVRNGIKGERATYIDDDPRGEMSTPLHKNNVTDSLCNNPAHENRKRMLPHEDNGLKHRFLQQLPPPVQATD